MPQTYKFTGKERDAESGLDHFDFRQYASSLGRFTIPDPENAGVNLDEPQSWNAYAYVNDNPTNMIDPTGLSPFGGFGGGWGGFGGGFGGIWTERPPISTGRPLDPLLIIQNFTNRRPGGPDVARTMNLGAPRVGFTRGALLPAFSVPDVIDRDQPSFAARIERPTAPRPILRMFHQLPRNRVRMHVVELLADLLRTPHVEVIESGLPEPGRKLVALSKCETQLHIPKDHFLAARSALFPFSETRVAVSLNRL